MLEVDVIKLADQWKGPASPARADLAAGIARLSSTETGRAQAAKLSPFIRRVFATADATPPELDTAARLVGAVPPAEAGELVEVILARPGWEAPLLWDLPDGEPRRSLAERVFKDPTRSGRARATAVRVGTGDGSSGYGPMLKAALTDPDPEVRDTAGDSVARAKCTEPLLNDVLAVLATELARPTMVPGNKWAHTRLVDHYQNAISRCLGDASDATRHATVAAAIQRGLRLEPTEYSTPLIYLELVAWAEHAAPQSVVELLALAEKACGVQKHDTGKVLIHRVVQWRLLRALKASDLKQARVQLALLKPKNGYDRIPMLEPTDLGTSWKVSGREERMSDFVARMQQRIDPSSKPKKRLTAP